MTSWMFHFCQNSRGFTTMYCPASAKRTGRGPSFTTFATCRPTGTVHALPPVAFQLARMFPE